jgi:hypothetical protein
MSDFVGWDLTTWEWFLAGSCAFLIGISKTGISGAGLMVVPIMATIFGGKPSTGLLLPILIFADVFAVSYYNRHARWKHVFKLLPWAIIGIFIALYVGKQIKDEVFKEIMAIIVLAGIVIMVYRDINKNIKVPDNTWFSAILGIAGGFSTMIGNAAGPIMALYLLSMRLPKNNFIGTGAWFFFIVNVLKVPLHVFAWETINVQTFVFDVLMIPAIALGAISGFHLVKLIPEKFYRILVIATTCLSAFLLF